MQGADLQDTNQDPLASVLTFQQKQQVPVQTSEFFQQLEANRLQRFDRRDRARKFLQILFLGTQGDEAVSQVGLSSDRSISDDWCTSASL